MEKTYTKNEDGKLEVVSTPTVKTSSYDISFLKKQLVDIQTQKDEQMAQRDIELVEITVLIAECNKLDIVEEVGDIEK